MPRSGTRCRVPRGVDRTANTGLPHDSGRRCMPRHSRDGRRAGRRNRSRRDLLLPVVLDSRQGRALGALVRRARRRAGAVDAVHPDPRPVLVGEREGRPRADAGDRCDRGRHARRLVVGVRLAGERAAAPGRAGCDALRARGRDPRRAVSRSHARAGCGGHREASPRRRVHRLLPLRRRSRSRLGVGRGARLALRRSRVRPHDARRTREGIRDSTGSTPTTS